MAKGKYTYSVGRRKSATATVRLYPGGKGNITVNDKSAEEYFSNSADQLKTINQPFKILSKEGAYDVTIKVSGGGLSGQADAIRLAISKCLAENDDAVRGTLKKADFLKRDPREKERKKYGLKRARKKEQFSKR